MVSVTLSTLDNTVLSIFEKAAIKKIPPLELLEALTTLELTHHNISPENAFEMNPDKQLKNEVFNPDIGFKEATLGTFRNMRTRKILGRNLAEANNAHRPHTLVKRTPFKTPELAQQEILQKNYVFDIAGNWKETKTDIPCYEIATFFPGSNTKVLSFITNDWGRAEEYRHIVKDQIEEPDLMDSSSAMGVFSLTPPEVRNPNVNAHTENSIGELGDVILMHPNQQSDWWDIIFNAKKPSTTRSSDDDAWIVRPSAKDNPFADPPKSNTTLGDPQ